MEQIITPLKNFRVMANKEHSTFSADDVEQFAEGDSSFCVEVIRHFIEKEKAWITNERPRDSDTLSFASGQGLAPIANHRVKPLRKTCYDSIRPRNGKSRLDVGIRKRGIAKRDVVAECSCE
jgi:hypothetical protein